MDDVLRTLDRRYGDSETDLSWSRVMLKENRAWARIEVIDEQLSELSAERRRLRAEIERLDLTKRTLADDIAQRIRIRHNEGWSPTPVVGYRLWSVVSDTLVGATGHQWGRPEMDARCTQSRPHDDLPHTDHLCSQVGHGCGIYAALRPGPVAPNRSDDWVLGIVLLSGKVVEHEHGYRAAHALVAAVVACAGGKVLISGDKARIEGLFASPVTTIEEWGEPRPKPLYGTELLEVVEDLEREMDRWTSENSSA